MRKVSAAISLFVFWVLLSGYFTPFLLTAGAVSAFAVVVFARRLELVDPEGHPVDFSGSALRYWPWLGVEIVKSAWDVSRLIVDPKLPISPTLVRVKPTQVSAVGRVVYANSITLTPGTVTVVAGREEFLVHAITRAGAESLAAGDMDRRVTRFEGTR
ncbi:MAG: Na+/H+ antiporter subunit E [Burkholderiales bacterium]